MSAYADKALMAYNLRLDGCADRLLRFAPDIDLETVDVRALFSLKLALDRVAALHSLQLPSSCCVRDALGAKLGFRWTPVSSVGVYVPGGTASYLSSVIMCCVPARIAGVGHISLATPYSKLANKPLFMACAKLCGVACVYPFGGAHAVAALSVGTRAVRKVDKIVGPGNAYVAAAKALAQGRVGVDCLAGPSEAVIVADGVADA